MFEYVSPYLGSIIFRSLKRLKEIKLWRLATSSIRQKFPRSFSFSLTHLAAHIHFRIHCQILLSLWGPSGASPEPTPLSCCNPTCPHAVSGQLINSWVCLKQSFYSRGNVLFCCGPWIMELSSPTCFASQYTVCFWIKMKTEPFSLAFDTCVHRL